MARNVELIRAPAGLSPGEYVWQVYDDEEGAKAYTPSLELTAVRHGQGWRIELDWPCPNPVCEVDDDLTLFVDGAALLAPAADDVMMRTMGAPGKGVEGVLWRADRPSVYRITAEGLGSVERYDAPGNWTASADWSAGRWRVTFDLGNWEALTRRSLLGLAVWRGAARERGGLKSVSSDWLEVS